tara:strand:+ start:132 stop:614 length:483 start_codon:yes stop_codon:yes gene_type:complete
MKELVTFRKYLNEGIINEGVNLNDTLDTPQELMKFITGGDESGQYGEAETILDDLTDVEGSVIGGETVWHNMGEFNQEDWDEEEWYFDVFRDDYFDAGKPLTKKEVIKQLLISGLSYDYHAERGIGDDDEVPEDWEQRQHSTYSLIAQKAKAKYGIENVY